MDGIPALDLWHNAAVFEMIIKGRSPAMRHVSRTHRVAFHLLFDRINIDSKIQVRNIDTKHQLADILTKGNFTRDEWNSLLHLFNISHFRSTCCAKDSSFISCPKTMAKRMQEQKGEEVWQNRNLQRRTRLLMFRQVPHPRKSPIASESPEILTATGKPESRMRRNSKSDAASNSQARLEDAYILWRVNGHSHEETCRCKTGIRGCGRFGI